MEKIFYPILGRLGELKMTATEFGKKMGIGRTRCHMLVNGEREFKSSEIKKACEILKIANVDIPRYFFAPEYSKTEVKTSNVAQNGKCKGEGGSANA